MEIDKQPVNSGLRIDKRALMRGCVIAILASGLCLMMDAAVASQEVPANEKKSADSTQESDEIAERIAELEQRLTAMTAIDQSTKDAIQADLNAAKTNLSQRRDASEEITGLREEIQSAEERANTFQRELEELNTEEKASVNPQIEEEELQQSIANQQLAVDELKKQLENNELENTKRVSRAQQSQKTLEGLSTQVEDLRFRLESENFADSLSGQVSESKLKSELSLAQAKYERLRAEVARDEAEEQHRVLQLEHDLIKRKLDRASEQLNKLESIQAERRQQMAQQSAADAAAKQEEIKQSTPLLVASYERNTQLAERAKEIEQQTAAAKSRADQLQTEVKTLVDKFRETKVRVKTIGLTGSVGAILRTRQSELLELTNTNSRSSDSRPEIEEIQFEIYEVLESRREIDPEVIRKEVTEEYGDQDLETWQQLQQPIAEVVEERKKILGSLKESLSRLSTSLVNVQVEEAKRTQVISNFRDYISENILWIRSNSMLFSEFKLDRSDYEVFSLEAWQTVGLQTLQALGLTRMNKRLKNGAGQIDSGQKNQRQLVGNSSVSRLMLTLLGSCICLLLIVFKPRLNRELDKLGAEASRGACISFWPTAHALLLTIVASISVPLIGLLLGLAIIYAPFQGSDLFYAFGRALMAAAMFAIPAEIIRRICRPQGLANQHFDWPDYSVTVLKRNLQKVIGPGSFAVFILHLFYHVDRTHRVDMVERLIFIIGMCFSVLFLYRIFNAKNGIFSPHLRTNEKSWANQTSLWWTGLLLSIPLILGWLAFWGYFFTSLNLARCAFLTLTFALAVETIRSLARRFVLIRRRRAMIMSTRRQLQAQEEARNKSKAEKKGSEAGTKPVGKPNEEPLPSAEAVEIVAATQPEEIETNVQQAYKLISLSMMLIWAVGLWMIWTDVLPALKSLDNYTLWSETASEQTQVAGSEKNSTDVSAAKEEDATANNTPATTGLPVTPTIADAEQTSSSKRVTVRDLLIFVVIAIITWVAAINLPSAFEILFLEDLPVDRSFRYAIKALTSYAIILIGLILAFNALSIGWDNVQWLATALTFGLAFGLQEIFANFVAGIILMFERPMRIGDLITVDQFTGYVTKIRTRATTIVNFDRKEFLIPNKDFITGRFVNWTLSDAINRIEFTVGIAYGSDVNMAKSIIFKICEEHPKVVVEPATQVIFNEFAESSLNLIVRAFISEIDCRPHVTDSLHTQINQAFNEAGIEISFPQRDLHLRSIDNDIVAAIENKKER